MNSKHHTEEIIEKIGGCGKYQYFLSVMIHLMKLPTVFTMYLMLFSIATPKWWCGETDYESLVFYNLRFNASDGTINTTSKESLHHVAFNTSNSYDNSKNCKNRNGTECKSIIFSGDMNTIVSEVCFNTV